MLQAAAMAMVPRICQARAYQRSLGHEGTATELALHVRDRVDPDTPEGNHTSRVRARTPEAIDELFRETDALFSACPHRLFVCDPTTPPEFVARLLLEGYTERAPQVQLAFLGQLAGARPDVTHVPVEDPGTWRRLAVLVRMQRSQDASHGFMAVADRVIDRTIAAYRAKAPSYRLRLAVVNGQDHGYYGSIVCGNRIAVIDDLFVCPQYRRLGIGRALLQHAVTQARESRALGLVIGSSLEGSLVPFCSALGFAPTCIIREYIKRREPRRSTRPGPS